MAAALSYELACASLYGANARKNIEENVDKSAPIPQLFYEKEFK